MCGWLSRIMRPHESQSVTSPAAERSARYRQPIAEYFARVRHGHRSMVVLFCAPDEIYSCPQFGVVDFARCGTIRFTLGVELSSEGWGYSVFRAWGRRSTASQHGGCALLSRPTHGP